MAHGMTGASQNERLIGGRYALEKIIGEGATGEVWRARHTALQSLVAIKFLHGSAAFRESTRKRFLKEAQVAARLNTRHAVQVFDFGVTEQGRPYLIMELLAGETLARRLVRLRRLTPAQTGHILKLASRALERAHALGIVHRDFKPENIFLSEDEDGAVDVKVVDFGVAKLVGDLEDDRDQDAEPISQPALPALTSFTRTGATVGTPSYMSPEQALARPGIGPAADIWAMGVVAYECLTGVRPFRAPTIEALFQRIAKRSCAPAHDMCPDVPVEFDDWFRTACEPDPNKRFPDAAVAAAALLEALGIQPNATALLDADFSGQVSQSFRLSASRSPSAPAEAQEFRASTSEPRSAGLSSKPAPFVRSSSHIDRPSPIGRLALAALVLASIGAISIAAWRWTRRDPVQPLVVAAVPAPASSPVPSEWAPAAPSATVSAAASVAPAAASSEHPRASAAPAYAPPPRATSTAEPMPSSTRSTAQDATAATPAPSPSSPPRPSATKTQPSSPFQLPDLGL